MIKAALQSSGKTETIRRERLFTRTPAVRSLARACCQKNRRFTEVYADSHEALRRYVKRFVHSAELADDIVQEAFLRTYACVENIEIPRAFLFSTARNLVWNQRRHERVARTDSMADMDELQIVSEGNPENTVISEEWLQLLQQALDRLPGKCRAAFALRVLYECPYRDIADRLGISIKTVEKHVSRGLRETHEYLSVRYRDARTLHTKEKSGGRLAVRRLPRSLPSLAILA